MKNKSEFLYSRSETYAFSDRKLTELGEFDWNDTSIERVYDLHASSREEKKGQRGASGKCQCHFQVSAQLSMSFFRFETWHQCHFQV